MPPNDIQFSEKKEKEVQKENRKRTPCPKLEVYPLNNAVSQRNIQYDGAPKNYAVLYLACLITFVMAVIIITYFIKRFVISIIGK